MAGVLSTGRKVTSLTGHCQKNNVTKYGAVECIVPIFVRCKSFHFSDPKPGKDYQHMKKTIVPTFHFQDSLPRLPIPNLKPTCERYLRAQKPLLDSESFRKTRACVESFQQSDGIRCQSALIRQDEANTHTSYITQPWFDMYLSDRKPLPINFNPFLVFVNNPEARYNRQLVKASNLVVSSLRFYKSLNEEILEPEVYHMNPKKSDNMIFRQFTGLLPKSISWYGAYLFKAFPLDMSQYPNLFNTTRVPKKGKDIIKHVHGRKHLLVMRGGNFYIFDVLDKDGNVVPPDVMISSIEHIMESTDAPAEHPVSVLTTQNRDFWASARAHLESLGNEEVLDLIDSSVFLLALDDVKPGYDPVSLVRLFLHADGCNRWFDKSFSLILTGDGTAGVNFEHSWGDGVAVLRYFNDVHNDSFNTPRVHHDTLRTQSISVRKLEFKLDDKAKSLIAKAKKQYSETCDSLEVRVMDYRKFGRQLCKPLSISPDAMMQLAFQIAYDNLAEKQVATYESCSTAAFKHGRTETVRPCTIETQEICHALRKSSPASHKELQHMIVECSKIHSTLIKQAAMGLGFDRHLFALKLQADSLGLKPDLFDDSAYAAMNHNILSTSTLASDNLMLGAFGPVVRDGFGIGYSVWNDRLGSIVTNYAGQANGSGFIDALEDSLDTIRTILSSK